MVEDKGCRVMKYASVVACFLRSLRKIRDSSTSEESLAPDTTANYSA